MVYYADELEIHLYDVLFTTRLFSFNCNPGRRLGICHTISFSVCDLVGHKPQLRLRRPVLYNQRPVTDQSSRQIQYT